MKFLLLLFDLNFIVFPVKEDTLLDMVLCMKEKVGLVHQVGFIIIKIFKKMQKYNDKIFLKSRVKDTITITITISSLIFKHLTSSPLFSTLPVLALPTGSSVTQLRIQLDRDRYLDILLECSKKNNLKSKHTFSSLPNV